MNSYLRANKLVRLKENSHKGPMNRLVIWRVKSGKYVGTAVLLTSPGQGSPYIVQIYPATSWLCITVKLCTKQLQETSSLLGKYLLLLSFCHEFSTQDIIISAFILFSYIPWFSFPGKTSSQILVSEEFSYQYSLLLCFQFCTPKHHPITMLQRKIGLAITIIY